MVPSMTVERMVLGALSGMVSLGWTGRTKERRTGERLAFPRTRWHRNAGQGQMVIGGEKSTDGLFSRNH